MSNFDFKLNDYKMFDILKWHLTMPINYANKLFAEPN